LKIVNLQFSIDNNPDHFSFGTVGGILLFIPGMFAVSYFLLNL